MQKKIIILIASVMFLSGCATYKIQKGKSPYDQGYVYSRGGKIIPEYTLGKNNSVPDKQTAEERFRRRRKTVEYYCKKLGYIENNFKGMFVDPPAYLIQAVIGLFRMPAIAVRDYKYNHNPKYKEKVDGLDDAEYKAEKERIRQLKNQLNEYILKDLEKEPILPPAAADSLTVPALAVEQAQTQASSSDTQQASAQAPAATTTVSAPVSATVTAPVLPAPPAAEKDALVSTGSEARAEEKTALAPEAKKVSSYPTLVAIITAKPTKGASPLTVQFSAARSYSILSRIVSYSWDFGDGDTSTKKNPVNKYWSASYEPRKFTVTLTITDAKGQSASASTDIEVVTK